MKKDDLTVGPMALHFRRLAIPAALGMLFATLYNVVDVYFAGRLSTDAQAGLAIGYQAFFILMALGFGLSSALSALVSNAKGSGETSLVRKYISQGLIYAVILTLLSIIIGLFIGPKLIGLVSEPGSYRDAGLGYFGWLIFALPGFLIAYGGNGILQAHGDTLSMQRALMVAFVANIILNPLFMFGISGFWSGMGFNGIAAATITSQTCVMLFILLKIFQLEAMQSLKLSEFMTINRHIQTNYVSVITGKYSNDGHVYFRICCSICLKTIRWACSCSLWSSAENRTNSFASCPWHDWRPTANSWTKFWC